MLEKLRSMLRPRDSVVQEWEWYARNHKRSGVAHHLGDEWNTPAVVGLDPQASDVVTHIEKAVIEPQLGSVGTLLEIGAGGGRFTEALARHAKVVIAADTAPSMVRLLEQRFSQQPSIRPLLLSGYGLDRIENQSIDAAFSYDVFVHLSPWTTYAYLEELSRVLRPGGKAIIHHAHTFSELGWKRFLRDLARAKAHQPPSAQFMPMTPELMSAFASRAGLETTAALTSVVSRDCISVLARPN